MGNILRDCQFREGYPNYVEKVLANSAHLNHFDLYDRIRSCH